MRLRCWVLGRKGSEMEREEGLVSGCPMNMIVEVMWPGGSSSAPGRPRQTWIVQGPSPSSGQMPLALLSLTSQDRSHTCGCLLLTSPRSGSLLDGAEWVRWQRKHKLVSSDFSLQRQPPPASCRDGPVQPCSLQLETEGSRWPCLAQIPARLPGRCGRSDGVGARRRNT